MISLVIISRNEGSELEATVANLMQTVPPNKREIIVADDNSTDGSTQFLKNFPEVRVFCSEGIGVARARNFGANHATGEVIVFCDAHIRAPKNWYRHFVKALEDPQVGACAPGIYSTKEPDRVGYGLYIDGPELHATWHPDKPKKPTEVSVLPGCFLGMRREVFAATGGFDPGMRQLGGNDNEVSFRLWTFGYKLMVLPQVEVGHLFRKVAPYESTWASVVHNRLRMAMVHFGAARIERVVEALVQYERFPAGLALMAGGDHAERRIAVMKQRKFDDVSYFNAFDLTC